VIAKTVFISGRQAEHWTVNEGTWLRQLQVMWAELYVAWLFGYLQQLLCFCSVR
jgi:hypothetical protein